ncbi:S9 family peptidase [Streptomyces sp. NPDC053367]|uniref:S9 family peptidase n=1 Tax=Streptomyces sp. NPDC053367 TaxID=3365700 RepID=UPI0037CEE8C6
MTAADVARGRIAFGSPTVVSDGPGRGVWWQERRPHEAGRTALVRHDASGGARDVLGAPWSVTHRVHEYGGRAHLVLPDGSVLFTHAADQRIHRARPGRDPVPLSPPPAEAADARYADLVLGPDGTEVWCVREQDTGGGTVRCLAAVPLDGAASTDPSAVRVLAEGSRFYAAPTVSPDGARLAYLTWDHPRMPWDGTELRVAAVTKDGTLAEPVTVLGGPEESVLAPRWRDAGHLYAVSDASGWWNPHLIPLDGTPPRPLHLAPEEFAQPPWELGECPYGVLGDGRLAVLHGRGPLRLGVLDPRDGTLRDVPLPYDSWEGDLAVAGDTVVGVAASPTLARAVVRVDVGTGRHEVLARQTDRLPPAHALPVPYELTVPGSAGSPVQAYVYPPTAPLPGDPDGHTPWVVWVHGGPTGFAGPELDLAKAYFTGHGVGVVDVNYTGSSGFGRAHRDRLRGRWGVADVEDIAAVARELVARGLARAGRIAVRGGSAGGWTVLAAVTSREEFAAGVSYFGVSSLRALAAETHDFESRYIFELVGSADPEVYARREPLGRVGDVRCPVLLLQGLDDPVVPPAQSERFATALRLRGIPHAYLTFPGESHGLRDERNIITAFEAELSFYAQIFGFSPKGIPRLRLTAADGEHPGIP